MRKNPKFTVIVPIYNCDKYLPRCIESILNQSFDNFELILANDGSTDNSKEVCEKYLKKDKRIVFIDKKNSGVSDTRNKCLSVAKGEFVCFLDADDYMADGFFEEINKILEKYPDIDLVNFGMFSDIEDANYNVLSSDVIDYKECAYLSKNELKDDFVNLWDNTMLYNIVNKAFRRKIIKDNHIKFPGDYFGEDVKFNRLYLNHINSMYNSKKCFYHYIREREGAVTKKYKSDFFDIRKKEFYEFNDYFEEWNIPKEDYYEYSCRRYIERVLGCIENVYCSELKFSERYSAIKKMVKDSTTRECLKFAKPKSKKVKIMLIPIKLKMILATMLMGRMFNIVKTKFPSFFNKLKNRR